MATAPKRVRKQYVNNDYPLVLLRFEDGHEIKIYRGTGKEFDAYPGESVRVLALYDPTSAERELIMTRKTEEFDEPAE